MAIDAFTVRGDVVCGFARHNNIVMTVLAAAKDLVVIDHRDRLPGHGAVAGVAALAGKNMLYRFRRSID